MKFVKSSRCGSTSCVEVGVVFRKSSASGAGDCVQVSHPNEGTWLVRDSKDPDGPVLSFNLGEWTAFLEGIRLGEFDPAVVIAAQNSPTP